MILFCPSAQFKFPLHKPSKQIYKSKYEKQIHLPSKNIYHRVELASLSSRANISRSEPNNQFSYVAVSTSVIKPSLVNLPSLNQCYISQPTLFCIHKQIRIKNYVLGVCLLLCIYRVSFLWYLHGLHLLCYTLHDGTFLSNQDITRSTVMDE